MASESVYVFAGAAAATAALVSIAGVVAVGSSAPVCDTVTLLIEVAGRERR